MKLEEETFLGKIRKWGRMRWKNQKQFGQNGKTQKCKGNEREQEVGKTEKMEVSEGKLGKRRD